MSGGHIRSSRLRDDRALRAKGFQDSKRLHGGGGAWKTPGPGNGAAGMGSGQISKGSLRGASASRGRSQVFI